MRISEIRLKWECDILNAMSKMVDNKKGNTPVFLLSVCLLLETAAFVCVTVIQVCVFLLTPPLAILVQWS